MVRAGPEENNGQEKVFEPAIKAQYPDIKINRIIVPGDQYDPKIETMAAAKESLEIWGFGAHQQDAWARKMAEPLDQYILADKWDIEAYFLPGLPDHFKMHGKHFGLNQLTTYGSMMVYNKTMFEQAGVAPPPADWNDTSWTMDRMLEAAKKMTKNYGKPDGQYGVNWGLWSRMWSTAYLYGEDGFLPEHYTNLLAPRTNFATPGNIEGHQFRHDLIYKHQVHPDPAVSQGLNQLGDPFKTGKVAMVMDGGWLYWSTADIKDFKYGFAPLPIAKANKNSNYDDFWIMGSWSKNKETAWKVMRVLTDVKPVTDYSLLSGTPPTVREATEPYLKKISERTGQSVDDLRLVTQGAIDLKRSQEAPGHVFLAFSKINTVYDNEIQPFWAGKDVTAEKVWPDLTKKLDLVTLDVYNQFKDSTPKE